MLETPSKRVLAGFSLAIVTLVVAVGSMLLSALDYLHAYVPTILLGFGLLGAIILLRQRRNASAFDVSVDQVQYGDDTKDESPLRFLSKSGYWGWVILVSAVPIFILCHLLMSSKETIKSQPRPKSVAAKVALPPPPAPVTAPVTKFPDLKLTGFVCNGTNSTAVVNGSTIGIGRGVENVTLVAVESWGVIVEMNGVKKVIPLGD